MLHFSRNNLCLAFFLFSYSLDALDNGLALTPPMGWLAWQRFRCTIDCETFPDECISEELFKRAADLLVSEGYANVGYEYVIIDDCWLEANRSAEGKLQADKKRFPNGIKALAEYIHSKGLKLGIYEDVGTKTCEGYPGIEGHEEMDANTFAEWDIDYIKIDGCFIDERRMDKGFPQFGKFLNKTGRPIVYSCCWPFYQDWKGINVNYKLVSENCNLWRTNGDIQESYSSLMNIVDMIALKQDSWVLNAGPGHWNDPDMLLIGNFALSYEQSKTQMALWAILAAPLMMSNKLSSVRLEYKSILQNTDIIKVNQDKLGIQGRRIYKDQGIEVWVRPVEPKSEKYYSYAIAFVNRRTEGTPYLYSTSLRDLGLINPEGYIIKNLYSNHTVSKFLEPNSLIKVLTNPTGVVFLKASLVSDQEAMSSSGANKIIIYK
ncbi:alpha-N-acetylgalactosaminidase-like isoform X4 [Daktulosphaira vitifoliae]|uniref:alpha-N-acetylgalactosaminidase-like isoform X3 n=1 Tax=Daktulosphaira vitifoliae TaxID=58002 RepID=UPI0021AADC2D|nr:alpha-N-acetylgalactosaminidase-like isoform X3 [Daktulosphaira vitifoliae]XP_050525607.1 alpha-N-acetylgalactosaminidase-like isoform X4 [Daktulosphaira vitifoliae]